MQSQLPARSILAQVIFATRLKTRLFGSQLERAPSLASKQAKSIARYS